MTKFPSNLDNYVDFRDVIDADAINAIESVLVGPLVYNAKGATVGCKGDGQVVGDGVMNGSTGVLTSASGKFAAGDVGKSILVVGAGAASANLYTTIASFQSATQVTLAANSQTSVGAAAVTWGTDDTTALQAFLNTIPAGGAFSGRGGAEVYFPLGIYYFTGQITIPLNVTVRFIGSGRGSSVLLYQGSTQQRFLQFAGGNNGSLLQSIGIMGKKADPAVDIQTNVGGGSVYNSLINLHDTYIGFGYNAAAAFPSATHKSYSGINVQCDVFTMYQSACWGQNYAVRLRTGTTDAYLSGCSISSLPEGGEPRGIGLFCEDTTNVFNGTLHEFECNVAQGAECAALYRSNCWVIGHYCESSILPIKATTAILKIIGGKISTDNTSAAHLILATNSAGAIYSPYLGAPTPANSLADLINITSSPYTNAWDLLLPNVTQILGTLPATKYVVDQRHTFSWPGVAEQTTNVQTVTFGASITPDPSIGTRKRVTLTGATTVSNPTVGLIDGAELDFEWIQDSAGGHTVSYGNLFKTTGRPAMVTTLNTVTIDHFEYDAAATVWRWYAGVTGQ